MSVLSDDQLPFGEDDDDEEESATCKHCGETGLEWIHTGVRWRLIDAAGKFHVCKNDHVIDDFEVLPD